MMTAKEYLQQIYRLDRKIKRLEAKREAIRADLYSVKSTTDYNADRVQTSVEGDTMLRLIAKVDSIERDIIAELNQLISLKDKISRQIESVQNERQKAVLFRRYVLCERWEQIAVDLNVSVRYVYMIHGEALHYFAKYILKT